VCSQTKLFARIVSVVFVVLQLFFFFFLILFRHHNLRRVMNLMQVPMDHRDPLWKYVMEEPCTVLNLHQVQTESRRGAAEEKGGEFDDASEDTSSDDDTDNENGGGGKRKGSSGAQVGSTKSDASAGSIPSAVLVVLNSHVLLSTVEHHGLPDERWTLLKRYPYDGP